MDPAETAARSPLDKPLAEITEEDIAQLTREDCRRFLKSKGMRRPSWNKSQVIQQVISLKALLEGRPGADDCPAGGGILQKAIHRTRLAQASPPQESPSPAPLTEEGCKSLPAAPEVSSYRRRDPIPTAPPYFTGISTCQIPIAVADQVPTEPENRCLSPRETAEMPLAGQMTIFYDGVVNVYDDMADYQARAVLELAASRVCIEDLTGVGSPIQSMAFGLPAGLPGPAADHRFARGSPIGTMGLLGADGSDDGRAQREREPEVATGRKASLQRYLEKRKDRFKGKKLLGGSISSSMEIHNSQKVGYPNQTGLTDLAVTSTMQTQAPRSPAWCSLIENPAQTDKILIDLNIDGTKRHYNFVSIDYFDDGSFAGSAELQVSRDRACKLAEKCGVIFVRGCTFILAGLRDGWAWCRRSWQQSKNWSRVDNYADKVDDAVKIFGTVIGLFISEVDGGLRSWTEVRHTGGFGGCDDGDKS